MKKYYKAFLHWINVEFIIPFKNGRYIKRDRRALARAKKLADHLSETHNGKKILVLKDYKGDYVTVDKDTYKLWKLPRRGRIDKNTTWQDLCDAAAYIAQKKWTKEH